MSWKTTVFGLMAALGGAVLAAMAAGVLEAGSLPKWVKSVAALASVLGTAGMGFFARDNNVTSEQAGAGRGGAGSSLLGLVAAAGLGGVFLCGCANFSATAFRLEKVAADSTGAGVHSFNVYYRAATNGASGEELAGLERQRLAVYGASRRVGSTLEMVEELRREYVVNQTVTNRTALELGLRIVAGQASNVVWLVRGWTEGGQFSAVPGVGPGPGR